MFSSLKPNLFPQTNGGILSKIIRPAQQGLVELYLANDYIMAHKLFVLQLNQANKTLRRV